MEAARLDRNVWNELMMSLVYISWQWRSAVGKIRRKRPLCLFSNSSRAAFFRIRLRRSFYKKKKTLRFLKTFHQMALSLKRIPVWWNSWNADGFSYTIYKLTNSSFLFSKLSLFFSASDKSPLISDLFEGRISLFWASAFWAAKFRFLSVGLSEKSR